MSGENICIAVIMISVVCCVVMCIRQVWKTIVEEDKTMREIREDAKQQSQALFDEHLRACIAHEARKNKDVALIDRSHSNRCEQCGRDLSHNKSKHSCDGCACALPASVKVANVADPSRELQAKLSNMWGGLTVRDPGGIPSYLAQYIDPELVKRMINSSAK